MITVNLAINGVVIIARSARRIEDHEDGTRSYKVDSGETVLHNPKDGAKVLGMKLLELVERV